MPSLYVGAGDMNSAWQKLYQLSHPLPDIFHSLRYLWSTSLPQIPKAMSTKPEPFVPISSPHPLPSCHFLALKLSWHLVCLLKASACDGKGLCKESCLGLCKEHYDPAGEEQAKAMITPSSPSPLV